MSKLLAYLFLLAAFVLPQEGHGQVLKKASTIPGGDFALSAAPAVYMDGGTNDIGLFLYGQYGLGSNTNFRVRAGFFEADNYIGGNFEWTLRRSGPSFTFSLGGHYVNDPAADVTFNLTVPLNKNVDLYGGLDADLIVDDDPDLPLWTFLGFSYSVLDHVDVLLEFNAGIVEIAPHILSSGFVFYF
ncbi:MAG: hypothetical protein AAF564_05850 [Bacteroidota bacterium]